MQTHRVMVIASPHLNFMIQKAIYVVVKVNFDCPVHCHHSLRVPIFSLRNIAGKYKWYVLQDEFTDVFQAQSSYAGRTGS